jgi:hypothetical protein
MRTEEADRYADPRRLIAAMQRDGVPLGETAVLAAVDDPPARWRETG